jgi:hypothetical protein
MDVSRALHLSPHGLDRKFRYNILADTKRRSVPIAYGAHSFDLGQTSVARNFDYIECHGTPVRDFRIPGQTSRSGPG